MRLETAAEPAAHAERLRALRIEILIEGMARQGLGWEDICRKLEESQLPVDRVRVKQLVLTQ
jgi:hypothetical protein